MIKNYWSTHIMHTNINDDAYVAEVGTYLKQRYSNTDNWPTDLREVDIFKDEGHTDPILDKVEHFITNSVNAYLIDVFNVTDLVCEGSELSIDAHATNHKTIGAHQHNCAVISGIFYVDIDDGAIIFHDPRVNASRGYPSEYRKYFENISIMPKAGDIILFPGFLMHEVINNYSENPRIIIPFDVSEEVYD